MTYGSEEGLSEPGVWTVFCKDLYIEESELKEGEEKTGRGTYRSRCREVGKWGYFVQMHVVFLFLLSVFSHVSM